MGAHPVRAARVVATTALLSCLIALLVPLSSAHAAPVHRPAGLVTATVTGLAGPTAAFGTGLDAVPLTAAGHHGSTVIVLARSGTAAGHAQHICSAAAPRGPPGRRL